MLHNEFILFGEITRGSNINHVLSTNLEIHVFAVNILQALARFLSNLRRTFLHAAGVEVALLFRRNLSYMALFVCCGLEQLGAFLQYNGMFPPCSFCLGMFLLDHQIQPHGSGYRVYLLCGQNEVLLVCPPVKSR